MVFAPGGSSSAYAPINESSRPGMVKYLNEGGGPVIRARRESAYRKMHDSCGGPYEILSEGPQSEGAVAIPVGNAFVSSSSQYVYISFKCASDHAEKF